MEENKNKKSERKMTGLIALFLLLTAACIVFSVLCLYNTRISFLNENAALFSVISSLLLSVFCGLSVWLALTNKKASTKAAISVFVFLLFVLVLIFILLKTGFFDIIKDEQSLEEYLKKSGTWMPVLYVILQYLQVVLLPIPSVVSTLAGVALFGPWWTLLYSYIGIWLGSISGFFIGRKLGYKTVAWMVGEETLQKWQNKLKGKDTLVLTLMFFLPMFPDDVFCFLSGLSTMKPRYFFIMITLSRIASISATCFSFELIPFNTWWGLLIWGLIIAVFATVFIFIYKNLDKVHDWVSKTFKRAEKKDKKDE